MSPQKLISTQYFRLRYHRSKEGREVIENGGNITDDIFKCIFFKGNCSISIKISMKCVLQSSIDDKQSFHLVKSLLPNGCQTIKWAQFNNTWMSQGAHFINMAEL